MQEILDFGKIKFKVTRLENKLIIHKTIFEGNFNKHYFNETLKNLINKNKNIEYHLNTNLINYKEIINILKNYLFKLKFKKLIFSKELAKVNLTDKLIFKTLNSIGKNYFLKIYKECIENTEDEDFIEDSKNIKKSFEEIKNRNNEDWNIIAFDKKGEPVGILILETYENYHSINFIGILPTKRGLGYSYLMLSKAEQEFYNSKKIEWLESTAESNKAMQKVFTNYGFKMVRESYCFSN